MKKLKVLFICLILALFVVPVVYAQGEVPPTVGDPLTIDILIGMATALLSLVFTFVPAVRDWYEPKSEDNKRTIMAVLVLVVAVSIFALGCAGLAGEFGVAVACTKTDLIGIVKLLFVAYTSNMIMFNATKQKTTKG